MNWSSELGIAPREVGAKRPRAKRPRVTRRGRHRRCGRHQRVGASSCWCHQRAAASRQTAARLLCRRLHADDISDANGADGASDASSHNMFLKSTIDNWQSVQTIKLDAGKAMRDVESTDENESSGDLPDKS